jgi:subtilase family serine protease
MTRLRLEPLDDRAVPSVTNTAVVGYTPQQVRAAYGFDQIPSLTADYDHTAGAGQTIAVVMAGDNPTIADDLHAFGQQFGLPDAPSFTRLSQDGKTAPAAWPALTPSWAGEIALDVEWAHAVAPAANLVLVEANSAQVGDLAKAIDTARKWPGVSVVSMSWGLLEGATERNYDAYLTTPAGHPKVTFVACSMDTGVVAPNATYWPAASPNVLAVGGTTLALDTRGTADPLDDGYGSETAWAPSTGGVSRFEAKPDYQSRVTQSGKYRNVPDVAYHADNTDGHGFPVYTTVPQNGQTGWFNAYGDSAGAVQWGALVALANQARAAAGGQPLDGRSELLPGLYNLGATNPAGYFHDVTTGANGKYDAGPGYDLVTGLGTPRADQLVPKLAALTGSGSAVTFAAPAPAGTLAGTAAPGGGFDAPAAPPDEATGRPKADRLPAPDRHAHDAEWHYEAAGEPWDPARV